MKRKRKPLEFGDTLEAKKIRGAARAFGEALGDLMIAAIPAVGAARVALAEVQQAGPLSTETIDRMLAALDRALETPCLRDLYEMAPPMWTQLTQPLQLARAELIARKEAC